MTTPALQEPEKPDGPEPDRVARIERRRSRRSERRTRRTVQRLFPFITALAVFLVVLIPTVIYSYFTVDAYEETAEVLQGELYKKEEALKQLQDALQGVRQELDALVQERLPHLYEIEFDKVLPVEHGYVRNIVFTLTKRGDNYRYEYKLVTENNGSLKVRPNFRVLVFDRAGIQIGADTVSGIASLYPGDSGSHSSQIDFFRDAEPAYFYVDLESRPQEIYEQVDDWPAQ